MNDGHDRVLIAGAGPTGLTLGLCLRAYGIPFEIIDAKSGPSRDSKALALNPLSMDQLELFGWADVAGRHGCRISRLNISYNGTRLNPVDLRWLDHDRRFLITQPQHVTEQELLSALEASGGRVAWNTELVSVAANEDPPQATIRSAAGEVQTRAYRYVVGCDGKWSRTREAVGAEMKGAEYPVHLVLGDFELDWDADRRQAHYYVYDDTFFVIVPHGVGTWRVVVKYDGPPERSAPGPESIMDPVRRHFGRDPFSGPPSWFSKAPLYLKIADRMRSGSVFLAGDAVHLYSPIGGTGMNTAMQDALNLGWKLAFTMRGWAKDGRLLTSYEQERLPAINANATATDAVTRLIARLERSPERVSPFLPRMANRRILSRHLPAAQSGLTLQYPASDALATASPAAPHAGSVCRGLPALLRIAGREPGRGPCWYLLVGLDDGSRAGADLASLMRVCERFVPHLQCIPVYRAEASASPRVGPHEGGADALAPIAVCPALWRRLGIEAAAVQVVRPDGIIFYAGRSGDAEFIGRHLASVLVERSAEAQR